MGALVAAVIAVAGLVFGWIAIEMACKPCLDAGREAIDRSLNPDYDPDDDDGNVGIRSPLVNRDAEDSAEYMKASSVSTSTKAV